MRIAINSICAVTGGAVTHLQNILPWMLEFLGGDELLVVGNSDTYDRIQPPEGVIWIDAPGASQSIARRLLWENTELPRLLREQKADVVFHPTNVPLFRSPIPQVLLIHNVAPFLDEIIASESLSQRLRLRALRLLTLRGLRTVANTIFISEWGRQAIERFSGGTSGTVIPFGCEHLTGAGDDTAALARWGLARDGFILTVSHLYRYKKIEYLIDAHAGMESPPPLVIVGKDYDREYGAFLHERARHTGSEIIFTGALAGKEISALMGACQAFVFTSEAENLPITLLEAMANGCAILTNRSCSMPEVCDQAALYADPPSGDTYGRELRRMIEDETLRGELRRRSLIRSDGFRWRDTAARTLDLIRETAGASLS